MADIAERIASVELSLTALFVRDADAGPATADDAGLAWLLFAHTANFSFWHGADETQYAVTRRGRRFTGQLALCAAINRALEE